MTMDGWGRMSRAERDAAYNNTAACPGGPAYMEALRAESAAFRAARPDHLDLAYGPSQREAWDLFPGPSGSDCLVFIHGGYWQRNDREGAAALVEGALASGWSAGGHLAAMALAHPAVTAAMPVSGIFELGPLRDTYLNEKLSLTDDEVATLSPLRLPAPDKPMGLAYGTAELPALIADSRALHARRAVLHRPGALLPVPHADHFTVLDALRRPGGALLSLARALLEA